MYACTAPMTPHDQEYNVRRHAARYRHPRRHKRDEAKSDKPVVRWLKSWRGFPGDCTMSMDASSESLTACFGPAKSSGAARRKNGRNGNRMSSCSNSSSSNKSVNNEVRTHGATGSYRV